MSPSKILVETVGTTSVIAMHDPERRNAISLEMRLELVAALESAGADAGCRAIVLTGSGGVFSAGGDLSSMTSDRVASRERLHAIADVIRVIVGSPKPVVAAVDGYAYGAGLSFASACDHVVASTGATFCCAFAGVGLTADAGLHWSLPARVGYGRSRTMIFLGDVVAAPLALSWGLVDTLADDDSRTAALAVAQRYAERAPLSLTASKAMLAARAASLDVVLQQESDAQQVLLASADFAEGREAFLAKRRPTFEGR